MDNEQPHQELVKCVVVGDTAVGKTRLICARACNKHVSLSQLLTTHVPTVWAIDQYRIYKDVLERSWEVVDNVNVSLRLWDTFGDHEKDRRFAYGRSDVVLLCFSITNPVSLRNCKAMWYPEIRRFCPQTPVLLVGCKNDLRYMYRDETYLSYFRDRSPFVRATRKSDLVMPDQARAVARELGVCYYETSVFTYYGVNEVFENSIRAALIARRQQRFWMTNLKRVQRPLLQAPFCPPKPVPPEVCLATSTYEENMKTLWMKPVHTDVTLIAGNCTFSTHRCLLAAASPAFHRLFTMELIQEQTPRSSSESSMVSTFGEATVGDFNDDTECLIRIDQSKPAKVWEQLKRRSSFQVLPTMDNQRKSAGATRELNHPAFQNIRVCLTESTNGVQQPTTVVTLSKLITPQAMQQCLQFIYTGSLDKRYHDLQTAPIGLLLEIRQAAEFLELLQLLMVLGSLQTRDQFSNDLNNRYKQVVRQRLEDICLEQGLFADVVFDLDDGSVPAHKAILTARCDVMKAMFSGDFRESSAKVIVFPGVREYTFHKLLCYLYTDEVPAISSARCLNLLELANRLCLQRLVNLVESRVIEDLERLSQNEGNEAVENCLRLLEPCKLHNADQLADWCMNHLCVNYNKLCKMSPRSVRLLHPENQEYLNEHRWPPVWYLKDYDYYQKCLAERDRENKPTLKRNRNQSGCLCFSSSSKTRRESSANGGTASSASNDAQVERPLFDASIESGEQVV
ncbi:rho-related BTB domain-containing protein 1 isoform X1 [Hylaeus anthracinus]|uniref:rho-related BTB domain-containing protein 1 isoform X1 n=1 Tax=Hylaeus volcanicus TaxID=313075 RepID=UPI0023B84F9A|nr:rho-related BTB domain-containing protein 1 isoform X1 [Hylaeus volcanicus]XP_053977692.1 rho-related BTB domain-containing protein 1 isoform X1 [Hylaeus volcanicus]XP_053977693.1 rho-related BTB domain-containing protein 1 isoform X1 [Hylaeus volcanicus]XP_053977695.1 rho-related BTB domain-containing protein 1 isoform X1 [Hylaeus volcanicus]XP_053977696.1 rho-related BTB domain-containing protein 1 isoform X1 [Hylaeus volcanicus]XP_054001090.1 rho-related BTB domain-containing protein 1 i